MADSIPNHQSPATDSSSLNNNLAPYEEQPLQLEPQRLRELFMNAPASIAIMSGPDLVFELANPFYQQLLGAKRNIVGLPIAEVLPDLDPELLNIIKRVAFTGERFTANEIPVILDWDDNGQPYTKYFDLIYEPLFDAQQQPNGITCFAIELTEQVVARRRIQESEEKYRSLFETMDQGFCILEMIFDNENRPLDYRFLEINPVFELQTGLKDAVGKTARELVPNLEAHWFELYGKVALTGESTRFIEGSDAMERWFEVYAFRIGGDESRKVALLFTNITERKKAEEERTQLLAREHEARQAAEEAAERLYLLQELTSVFAQARTMSEVVEIVRKQAAPLLGAYDGWITLLAENRTQLRFAGSHDVLPDFLPQDCDLPLSLPSSITDAVQTQLPVWIHTDAEYRARYQRPLPEPLQGAVSLPLFMHYTVGGVLTFTYQAEQTFDQKDRALLTAISDQCAQAIDRVWLLEKERDLIIFEERHRLARDLHDAVSQVLFSAGMITETLPRLWKTNPDKALKQLEPLHSLIRGASAEMRTLLWELRPESIVQTKLSALFTQLAYALQTRKQVKVTVRIHGEEATNLPPDIQIAFYRIAQESISNIFKHGQANNVKVLMRRMGSYVALLIIDNGQGFDTSSSTGGLGLKNMKERAEQIGADFKLTSQPGKGTHVRLVWHIPKE